MHLPVKKGSILLMCVLYFLLQTTGTHVFAAQDVTTTQWQQLTSNKIFSYKNDTEVVHAPKEYKTGAFEKVIRSCIGFFVSKEGSVLLWIIVISAVAYIIFRGLLHKDSFLFGRNKKQMTNTGPTDDNEQDIATTNWELLLQKSVTNNDLRFAVRYSYMWLLQLMQERNLIQYRIDKTNSEYYSELNETSYKQPFKQLSRRYEYAWYGHLDLSPSAYSEYKELFDNMRKQLDA